MLRPFSAHQIQDCYVLFVLYCFLPPERMYFRARNGNSFCSMSLICVCPHDDREPLQGIQLLVPSQWSAQGALKVSIDVAEILSFLYIRFPTELATSKSLLSRCSVAVMPSVSLKLAARLPCSFLQCNNFFHLSQTRCSYNGLYISISE